MATFNSRNVFQWIRSGFGGFKYLLEFSSLITWGIDEPILTCAYFSDGLVQKPPTRSQVLSIWFGQESSGNYTAHLAGGTPRNILVTS